MLPATFAPGVPKAAFKPIAFFVILIIIANILTTFARKARTRRAKSSDAAASARLEEAMRKSSADLASARAAQRAKLQQAIKAALQPPKASGAPPPISQARAAASTAVPPLARPATAMAAAKAASPPAAPLRATTSSAAQPLSAQAAASLAGAPDIASQAMPSVFAQFDMRLGAEAPQPAVPQSAAVAPPAGPTSPVVLTILGGQFSGADLFVAAAVAGPCAAFRTLGHTPAGW